MGEVGKRLRKALDEEALGVRTLARRIADESGGQVESWRGQITRIIQGQKPQRPTAITIARALRRPDEYLVVEPTPVEATDQEVARLRRELVSLQREVAGLASKLQRLTDPE